jgi:hypothetical protein
MSRTAVSGPISLHCKSLEHLEADLTWLTRSFDNSGFTRIFASDRPGLKGPSHRRLPTALINLEE